MALPQPQPDEGAPGPEGSGPPDRARESRKVRSRVVEHTSDPTELTVVTLFIDFLDFGWIRSRKHVASKLTLLASLYRGHLSDFRPLLKIERAARNRRRFTRCYALNTLGRLGQCARRTVWTQADALWSPDPFVREAGARALWRMGDAAIEVKSQIISAIYQRVSEGTARYGLLWLAQTNVIGEEINAVLEFVLGAKDSYARADAERLLQRLAKPQNPDPPSGPPIPKGPQLIEGELKIEELLKIAKDQLKIAEQLEIADQLNIAADLLKRHSEERGRGFEQLGSQG
jgi:hypothetical protein